MPCKRCAVLVAASAALIAASGCAAHASGSGNDAPRSAAGASQPGASARTRELVASAPPSLAIPASPRECYDQLWHAGVTFELIDPATTPGVVSPLRLKSRLGGVAVGSRGQRAINEIIDCRLALRLLAWAPSLRHAGVWRIDHFSIYRRGALTPHHHVSAHAHALAIDAARFHLVGGEVIDVLSDWEERDRGGEPCPERPQEAWPSRWLRGVVCDAVRQGLFQVVITPHRDAAHGNHVHLELRPDVDWTYVR